MRTKALLLTAAMSAIGAAAMAEVTSVNVVGFVNMTFPSQGWYIIANPLNNTNNNLGSILTAANGAPSTTEVYGWDAQNQQYMATSYDGASAWDPDLVFPPGQAFWVRFSNAGTEVAPFKVTFIGEVPQGNLSTALKPGWNMVASQVPQAGLLSNGGVDDLGYVVQDGDDAYTWNPGSGWTNYAADSGGNAWDPALQLGIGQGLFLFKTTAGAWTRNFTVQ